MLIWTARVSKKTKAVVAVILAGILAAAVPAAGGPLRWRSGRGSLAADRQCRPHRLSGVHGLAGGGGTGGDAAVSAAGETGGALPHLQRAAGFPGLRPFCVLRQSKWPGTPTPSPTIPDGRRVSRPTSMSARGSRWPEISSAPGQTDSRTHWSIRSRTEPVRNGLRAKELPQCGSSFLG